MPPHSLRAEVPALEAGSAPRSQAASCFLRKKNEQQGCERPSSGCRCSRVSPHLTQATLHEAKAGLVSRVKVTPDATERLNVNIINQ